MHEIGMDAERFSARIGSKVSTLNFWLLPPEAEEFQPLPDAVWRLVREILEAHKKAD